MFLSMFGKIRQANLKTIEKLILYIENVKLLY